GAAGPRARPGGRQGPAPRRGAIGGAESNIRLRTAQMSLPEPATGVSPVTLLASLDSEAGRLSELVARLQRELDDAADAGEEADVIRRHVLRHPERFAPDERERASDRAQDLAGNRRTLEE